MTEDVTDKKTPLVKSLATFGVLCAALAIVIMALNWIPSQVSRGTVRTYGSIEELKRAGIGDLHVPTYFPDYVAWPPSAILAQTRPYEAIVLEFGAREDGRTALVIVQSSSENTGRFFRRRMLEVAESVEAAINGTPVRISSGACGGGVPCSAAKWSEDGTTVEVLLFEAPPMLMRIVESMIDR